MGLTEWFGREEIDGRYGDRESYLERVRVDAESLAAQSVILEEDVDLVVANCADRWDVAVG